MSNKKTEPEPSPSTPNQEAPLPMASVSTEANTFRVNTNTPPRPLSRPTPVHTQYQAYQEAQIIVVHCKGEVEGKIFPIYRSKSFVIGRRDPSLTDVELNLSCSLDTVSRLHCEISFDNELDSYVVKHLGESTFTYIDDKHIGHEQTAVLHSGSIIRNAQLKRINSGDVQEWLELRFESLFDTASLVDKSKKENLSGEVSQEKENLSKEVSEEDEIPDKEKTVELKAVDEKSKKTVELKAVDEKTQQLDSNDDETEKNSPTPKIGLPYQMKRDNPETAISEQAPDENPTEAIPKTDELKPPDDEPPTTV